MASFDLTDSLHYGDGKFLMIAGPCAVESRDQVIETAKHMKRMNVHILRGGAFKPRTSPDTFQGLGEEGLKLLAEARDETGLPIVTEVMDVEHIGLVSKYADILQVGSRNSQNFSLLKKLGKAGKPVLLKRGFGNTIEEFINSARYVSLSGNNRILLVERGIRTFEPSTRFTLDIGSVPVLQEKVDFPVIVDPSHPAGVTRYVEPLALSSIAAGADGLMVEVHPEPEKALSDANQQLNFSQFTDLMGKIRKVLPVFDKEYL